MNECVQSKRWKQKKDLSMVRLQQCKTTSCMKYIHLNKIKYIYQPKWMILIKELIKSTENLMERKKWREWEKERERLRTNYNSMMQTLFISFLTHIKFIALQWISTTISALEPPSCNSMSAFDKTLRMVLNNLFIAIRTKTTITFLARKKTTALVLLQKQQTSSCERARERERNGFSKRKKKKLNVFPCSWWSNGIWMSYFGLNTWEPSFTRFYCCDSLHFIRTLASFCTLHTLLTRNSFLI